MLSDLIVETVETEIAGLDGLTTEATTADIANAVELIHDSDGDVFTTGMGKSGDVARKIASTLSSVGVASQFLHPAEALHGDIGAVSEQSVVVFISNSGNTEEVVDLATALRPFDPATIAITSDPVSKLATRADVDIDIGIDAEGSVVELVPMASSTATMVVGDAIANGLMYRTGFDEDEYARFHPDGTIGKRLHLTVEDIYAEELPPVNQSDSLAETILKMSRGGRGIGVVVNESEQLLGVITDGDVRRIIESDREFTDLTAGDVMTADPLTITLEQKASTALDIIKRHNVSQLVVTGDDGRFQGVVHFHDIVQEGLN